MTDDKTAAGARMLLGSVHAGTGDLAIADVHLQAASALAPAWTQVIELRGRLLAAAGKIQEAQGLRRKCSELRQQSLRAIERLAAN